MRGSVGNAPVLHLARGAALQGYLAHKKHPPRRYSSKRAAILSSSGLAATNLKEALLRAPRCGPSASPKSGGQVAVSWWGQESGPWPPDFHSSSRIQTGYPTFSRSWASEPPGCLVRVVVPSPAMLRAMALPRVQILGAAKRSPGVDMLTGVNAVAPTMAPARKSVLSENMLVGGSGVELKRKRQDVCRDLERGRFSCWRGSGVLSSLGSEQSCVPGERLGGVRASRWSVGCYDSCSLSNVDTGLCTKGRFRCSKGRLWAAFQPNMYLMSMYCDVSIF